MVLRAQKEGPDWQKDDGEYIPSPLVYLNQLRFLDESITIRSLIEPSVPDSGRFEDDYDESDPYLVPDPKCPECRGGGLARDGPCKCLRPEREVLAERKRDAEAEAKNTIRH